MAQTEAANEERKREVQRLQQQLTGMRQSTQLQTYSRLEKESRRLRELSDDLTKRLAESEADALRTKGALKEREIQVQRMKDEYARLFSALQKQKQPVHYSPSKLTRSASSAQLSASQQNHSPQPPPRSSGAGTNEATDNGDRSQAAFQLTANMDAEFDGLNSPKHERVAKALEQVNGFRYRYHAAPLDGKKMLRFDSDDEEALSDDEDAEDSSDETQGRQCRQSSIEKTKPLDDDSKASSVTLDDHIENLLRKTRTLAMLKIANNTAGTIPSDSDDDSDEADDVVSEELKSVSLSSMGSSKRAASFKKLSSLGSSSNIDVQQSTFLGTAAMNLARTLSAFLCLPRAISYVDLEAITEKLLESSNDRFDDGEYADLIDYHVDSARGDDTHAENEEDVPIWKRRHSRPIRPLALPDDQTDLEMHQRKIFIEANRFGGVSSRNFFLASSKHLLSSDDSKGSMYFGVSPSGRLLGSFTKGSSMDLNFGRYEGGSTNSPSYSSNEIPTCAFNEEEYIMWRTQVKDDYLAWVNAKVEAQKRRKSRVKKVDPNKKPRWLLLYEASQNPTQKYRPDDKA
ncbi:hypothetical protein PInf_004140 [Phytophthora infestans]|nr:hypothetical protein PInf_004140 [Phytophthora infestans]